MPHDIQLIRNFVDYVGLLRGDEKGEAQVFCDRLFRAFGHRGYKEAGATLEYRIRRRSTRGTSFADLMWKPRLLIEMKKRGENLYLHYKQAFDYWIHAVPNRPRYVVLYNFDDFWIYDFDKQIDEPVDSVTLSELPLRYPVLNFLFPENPDPILGNDREAVSRDAADKVAQLFNALIARDMARAQAQRFVLQIVVAMFGEDTGFLPAGMVYGIVQDCLKNQQSSYDLFGALFHQMNNPQPASGGRFQAVPYFNGGLFQGSSLLILRLTNSCYSEEKTGLLQKTGRKSTRRFLERSSSKVWTQQLGTPTEHITHLRQIFCASSIPRLFDLGRRFLIRRQP
jgi:hypothetical protein